jgi:AraC family transcriptional regulator
MHFEIERKFLVRSTNWQQMATGKTDIRQAYLTKGDKSSIRIRINDDSAATLSRAFRQTFGMPPHRFHTHRRIERAKPLLTNPAASVTSVGMAVGFCETSSFSAAFRKGTGVTPSSFQRSVA